MTQSIRSLRVIPDAETAPGGLLCCCGCLIDRYSQYSIFPIQFSLTRQLRRQPERVAAVIGTP